MSNADTDTEADVQINNEDESTYTHYEPDTDGADAVTKEQEAKPASPNSGDDDGEHVTVRARRNVVIFTKGGGPVKLDKNKLFDLPVAAAQRAIDAGHAVKA